MAESMYSILRRKRKDTQQHEWVQTGLVIGKEEVRDVLFSLKCGGEIEELLQRKGQRWVRWIKMREQKCLEGGRVSERKLLWERWTRV